MSCAAAGRRRCAPPHKHPPYPSPAHHTTPERPPLTLRVLRRRRSQCASRDEYDLLLLGGASLNQGCTAAVPSWRSRRTQLQTPASPRRSTTRLQDAREFSVVRECVSVACVCMLACVELIEGWIELGLTQNVHIESFRALGIG